MSATSVNWEFQPHPFIRGGHLQSVVGIYLRHDYAPHVAKLHIIDTHEPTGRVDDEQLALHEDRPPEWQPGDSVVLMIHGLAGCYQSTYMRRCTQRLNQHGHAVFRLDMRGCGAGEGLARLPAHAGRGEDVRAAIEFIGELYPESPVQVIGFSLGGTITLNMLADVGELQVGHFVRALTVGPPIDLFDVERRFDAPGGRAYDKFFTRLLWKQIVRRWQKFPDLAPNPIPRRPRRLRQIDELVIAPGGGFPDADAYYHATQPGPRLASIRHPVTILAAGDDPVVPTAPLTQYNHSDSIEAIIVPGGGHLGFVSAGKHDPDRRWLDWRIVEWANELKKGPTLFSEESAKKEVWPVV